MTRFRVLIVALLVGAATSSLPASATVAADVTIVSPSSLGAAQHGPPRMNESAQYTSTVPLEPHQPDRRAHKPRKRRPKFPELLCPRSALNSLSGEHGGSTDVPGEGVDESPAVAPGSSEFWWHIGIIMGLLLVAALMVFTVFVKGYALLP